MNDNTKNNWSFWFSLGAIVLSFVTIILFFLKVKPNSVIDITTFIGAIAAFIGVSVTLVIGFQIYSFISIKDKIKELKSLKVDLLQTKKNILSLEVELKGMILYSEAKQKIEQDDAKGAFEKLHYALLHFAQLDSKKESLLTYVNLLDVLSTEIKESDFSQGNKQFYIKLFMTSERDIFLKMQKRKYYFVIKEIYDKLYFDLMKKVGSFNEENNEQPY